MPATGLVADFMILSTLPMKGKTYSLLDLTEEIKESLSVSFPETLWVKGEINEIRENISGHCYIELVEKDVDTDNIVAKARANIWAYTFRMLKPYFEVSTGQQLSAGISVLLSVTVEFHSVYGLSLNVRDIDPAYTLGDMEKKRLETIKKLEEDGIIDMNCKLTLPYVPKRIAVVSSSAAAGYQDFVHQLENNPRGFRFSITLFQSLMQGSKADESIVGALENIFEQQQKYDIVVIIRGGGATSDLLSYNSYYLASHIAQFPLPVLTGIGHERDVTVADMVACRSFKTPTAVSAFLVELFTSLDDRLSEMSKGIYDGVLLTVNNEKIRLKNSGDRLRTLLKFVSEKAGRETAALAERIQDAGRYFIKNNRQGYLYLTTNFSHIVRNCYIRPGRVRLANLNDSLSKAVESCLRREDDRLGIMEKSTMMADPENMLERGYSLVIQNNRVVKSVKSIKISDYMETKLRDGRICSKVVKILPR